MNVLVYSGPEVLNTSFARATSYLKASLVPHYAVQPVTLQSLTSSPWSDTCALLVFPACRDQLSLPLPVRTGIKDYVERGGLFLGLRASSRITGSGLASLDLRESSFRFQDRTTGTSLSCTLESPLLPAGKVVNMTTILLRSTQSDSTAVLSTDSAPTELEVPDGTGNVRTLVLYGEKDEERPAAIASRIGEGCVGLWALDIGALSVSQGVGEDSDTERTRRTFLNETLQQLGLKLPGGAESSTTLHLLPQFLTCSPASPFVADKIQGPLLSQFGAKLKDEHDTFAFHTVAEGKSVVQKARSSGREDADEDAAVKHIIMYPSGQLPNPEDTPLFNISQFYSDLATARSKASAPIVNTESWGIGEALLYGEVVTSTQTMLDKNHRFLSALPHPLLSIATHQIAGRGRGGNNWVSPTGCLQHSVLLRVPLKEVPAQRLVFIQYLYALAVAEACRDPDVLGPFGERVRIKWPNDLYVVTDAGEKRKIGGILVHSSFQGGVTTIVIGCGLNVLNVPPIASLAQLGSPPRALTVERTAATIMATFEPMWNTFVSERGSFKPFMDLYLDRWLHSDQLVTVTSVTPHRSVRVVGITEEHGLLRTIPERGTGYGGTQEYIDLQPDGNSFDLMSGLIMSKAR
ncbi:class II aaRS and biotin synthetase [Cristinia sonorae]|uniref:Class II aaRS and biotin synthetase n=1 Tax=Cristinia sonorae TaxID=1940300 RepID=A0A8K0URG4_9AGAR|nr:class II aaRS and biotin synthetase [Cristinia sonorae]